MRNSPTWLDKHEWMPCFLFHPSGIKLYSFSFPIPCHTKSDNLPQDCEQPFHKIPQVVLGSVDERHVLILMLPNATDYRTLSTQKFDAADATSYHNQCVLDVMRDVLPECYKGRVPLDEDAERFRSQRRDGRFVQSTFDLPAVVVQHLGPRILRACSEIDGGQHAFFYHAVKGAKGSTSHRPGSALARTDCFNAFASFLDMRIVDVEVRDGRAYGYVDVALEISGRHNMVISAIRAAHARILMEVLGVGEATAHRFTTSKSFRYDSFAGIGLLAGFGLKLDASSNPDGAVFVQVYMTEKSRLYLKDGGRYAKHIKCLDVMKALAKGDSNITELEGMKNVYRDAFETNVGYPARIEKRVPWEQAKMVFTSPDVDMFRRCFVAIPGNEWW